MLKLLKGTVLGGVVVFLWSAFSYMVLPWHDMTLGKFISEPVVSQVVIDQTARSGVYVLPNGSRRNESDNEEEAASARRAAEEQRRRGPVAFVAVRRDGVGGMGGMMAAGLVADLLGAFLVSWLLMRTRPLPFGERVAFVAAAAAFAGVACHLPYCVWWGFGAVYTAVMIADTVVGWTLAGLAIAKLTD